MSIGENLRILLAERDMTQKELAQKLNIAPSTMGSYVQNAREPDFATLKAIAGFFQVSIEYLLDYSPDASQSTRERELLRIFRNLSPEQKEICIEQCRVFLRANQKEKNFVAKSS